MKEIIQQQEMDSLERQLEHSGYYVHSILSRYAERINNNEFFLYGLIDYLLEKTGLSQDTLIAYVNKVKMEMKQKGEILNAGVALRVDGEQDADFTPVNCAERMPVCQAICCQLNFALTAKEIESGKLKWELGTPYYIRHEKNGFCSHLDTDKRCCSVYEDRPGICKKYSCAKDTRIWKDFDNMVLNQEWIDENLGEKTFRLVSMSMEQIL